jgi:hypothetical protein
VCSSDLGAYIIIDDLSRIYQMVDDNELFEQLAEAMRYGVLFVITWDLRKKKPTGNAFVKQLEPPVEGLILGSIKEQNLFSNGNYREDNRMVELGYHHTRGTTCKVKLIENE